MLSGEHTQTGFSDGTPLTTSGRKSQVYKETEDGWNFRLVMVDVGGVMWLIG